MRSPAVVLMGGWSAEREVSLVSGRACADALEAEGRVIAYFRPVMNSVQDWLLQD